MTFNKLIDRSNNENYLQDMHQHEAEYLVLDPALLALG